MTNFPENDFDSVVSIFWNNEKPYYEDFQENNYANNKFFGLSKFFTNEVSNNTKTTCDTNQNITIGTMNHTQQYKPSESSKKQKVFIIKKYVKYEEIIKEFCGEEEQSETEKKAKKAKIPKEKRIKLIKYNNKKLSNLEKVEKLKILSKVVRRYRRKIKNIKKKIKQDSDKIFSRYLNKHLLKFKKIPNTNQNTLSLKNLVLALKKLRCNRNYFESVEDSKFLETFISLLASGKLRPDSAEFKMICGQVRSVMTEQKMKILNKPETNLSKNSLYLQNNIRELERKGVDEANLYRDNSGFKNSSQIITDKCLVENPQEKRNSRIYDPILESIMNKNQMNSEEFCNNLFNTDVSACNNVFIK